VSGQPGGQGTDIGDEVTIGHMAVIHACTLEPGAFVGIGSIVLDNAVVESGAMVAAGSLVTARTRVKSGELWSGRPARLWRPLTDGDRARMAQTIKNYSERTRSYLAALGQN
jgi:carbonic anhydrase/acetyltransferase-like protein (isoleucine patch superfamily)